MYARGPEDEFEVVEGTADLLVQLDVAVLGQCVRVIARRTVQATRLGLDKLHVVSTLATPATCGVNVTQ